MSALMKHDVPPPTDEHRCAITGRELPADELVELFDLRVGAEGKAILLDRLRSRRPPKLSVAYPGVSERVQSAMHDGLPLLLLVPFGLMFGQRSISQSPINLVFLPSLVAPIYLCVMTALMRGQSLGKRRCNLKLVGTSGSLSAIAIVIRTLLISLPAWLVCLAQFVTTLPPSNMVRNAALCAAVWLMLDWMWLALRRDGQALHDLISNTRVVAANTSEARWLDVDQLGWSGAWDRAKVLCPGCNEQMTSNLPGPAIGAPLPVRDELRCESCGWNGTLHLFRPVPLEVRPAEPAVANEAVCTQHPTKRAIATCEKSGDYCCSLCLIEVDGAKVSAGYLQTHPLERDRLWPSLPAVDKPSLVIAGNYVAIPRPKSAKQQPETRLGYDKIDSMLVWSERRPVKQALIGLAQLGVAAGVLLMLPMLGALGVIAAIIVGAGGIQRLVTFARSAGRLEVHRDQEKLVYAPAMAVGDFAKLTDSLVTAIWRYQQAGIRAWFEQHPDDPHVLELRPPPASAPPMPANSSNAAGTVGQPPQAVG